MRASAHNAHVRRAPRRSGDVEALLGPSGLLARTLVHYEHRPAQLEMALAVERTLERDDVLIAEAGTGTGKTLAYLAPALLSGKKVVISTGTKALQDQILEHDLPMLTQHLSDPPKVASMKGLSNYLCLRRYEEFRRSAGSVQGRTAQALPILEDWATRTESGDQSELELPDSSGIWEHVQSSAETRVGARCPYYERCFVTRMRARADAAQLIVVNHHLFFADLALRAQDHPGSVLPEYDAVIFDEAHLIEDVATLFFGTAVSTTKIQRFLKDAARTLDAAGLGKDASRLLAHADTVTTRFFAVLPRSAGPDSARVPLAPSHFDDRLQEPLFAVDNALDGIAAFCKLRADASPAVAQIARRADQLRSDVVRITEGGGRGRIAYTETRERSVTLGASPVDVAAILREQLFYRGQAVVLTSATLSTSGSFEFFRGRLGIEPDAIQLQLPSPFDYPRQAALYLPKGLPDPREPSFPEAAEREISALVELTDGGAFVLCTSLRMMRTLAASLRRSLARTVLMHGELPSSALLERFKADGRAVLLASASFFQGVDVPGDALRLVIIDKLPFDVPTDPLIAARCDRLKQNGEQPFMKYLVPSAALTLKQGFGRLIRTRHDRGVVAILDRRLSEKGYGRVIERSLPNATRCTSLADVERFFHQSS